MHKLNKQFVVAIAVVLMTGVFVILQYLPTVRKAKAYSVENLQLITENSIAKSQLDGLPLIYEKIKKAKQNVGNYDAKIPNRRSHGAFLEKIAEIMQEHELNELMIRPDNEIKMAKYNKIPVSIQCNGKISNIFDFFKSLEGFERIIQIEDVSFRNSDDYNGKLFMEMKLNIFYTLKGSNFLH